MFLMNCTAVGLIPWIGGPSDHRGYGMPNATVYWQSADQGLARDIDGIIPDYAALEDAKAHR